MALDVAVYRWRKPNPIAPFWFGLAISIVPHLILFGLFFSISWQLPDLRVFLVSASLAPLFCGLYPTIWGNKPSNTVFSQMILIGVSVLVASCAV